MLFCPAYSQVAIKRTQHVVFESSAKLRCVQDPCEFALSLHPCLQGRVSKERNSIFTARCDIVTLPAEAHTEFQDCQWLQKF